MSRNRRTILVPLATLVAAGAIAVGSGATFTSQSGNTASSVVAGTLKHTNSKDNAAIFALTNLKPGDTLNGSLTLTNTGSLPANFSLTETASTNAFSGGLLHLTVTDTTTNTSVYDGTFGGLVDGQATQLGTFAAGDAHSYRFTVTLDAAATNAEQGKAASATFQWNSIQLDGSATDQ
jgi:spore coat-associated protein N